MQIFSIHNANLLYKRKTQAANEALLVFLGVISDLL